MFFMPWVRCVLVPAQSPRQTGRTVACILIFVLQPDWVKGVVPAGRPPVAEARFARIESLCAAEKNRLHAASAAAALPAAIRQEIRRSIAFQERALQRLTQQAIQLIAADALLQQRFGYLDSVPGIGPTSAIALLAELSLLSPELDVRQWVAAAGIDPREYSSGRSVHKKTRISKAGNRHWRRALYMPALVAVHYDPHLRAFYHHLLEKGKEKLQALVAVMRKLLHAIFGMFKHHQSYDGAQPVAILRSLVSRRSHEPQKRKGSFAILPKKKLATQERIYPEFFLLWFACSHRHAAILGPS